jgi:translation initiation factor 2 alpha subunit (eIF-2alpha)
MEFPIYENQLPEFNENVLVIFNEHKDTHIEGFLVEYNNVRCMMIYEDATRKKKVYDWKKEVPLNKPIVAKVEEILDAKFISISTAYFDNRIDKEELFKPFNENKALINIVKKTCYYTNLQAGDFWKKIIYKIDSNRREDDVNSSLLFAFKDNLNIVNDLIKQNYKENTDQIINELEKLINYKNTKVQTKFGLISKKGITFTKELLKLACQNIPNEDNYSIKYDTAPYYIFESNNKELNDSFIEYIQNNCNNYDIIYKE